MSGAGLHSPCGLVCVVWCCRIAISTEVDMVQPIDRMTLKDAIGGRCSVRAYSSEKIDKSTLQELMAAAVRAPTAMHAEPCQFVIVQDVSRLKRLSDRAKAVLATDARLHPDRHH